MFSDDTAVIILHPNNSSVNNVDVTSTIRAVRTCTTHFVSVYVVEYGADDSASFLQETLEDVDLHMIKYSFRRTNDPRQALKHVCTASRHKYVLLVDAQIGTTLTPTSNDKNIDLASIVIPAHATFQLSFLSPAQSRFVLHKRNQKQPPSKLWELLSQNAEIHPYVDLWERTALLLHLRKEILRCPLRTVETKKAQREASPFCPVQPHACEENRPRYYAQASF